MQKLCTNCHYVGKSKKWDPTIKILVFLFLSAGICFILLGFWHPILIIGAYISFLISSSVIAVGGKTCPECPVCNQTKLIPTNSHKAESIIRDTNYPFEQVPDSFLDRLWTYDCIKNTKRKICTICNRINEDYPLDTGSIRWGFYMAAIGVLTVPLALFHALYILLSAIFLLVGITTIIFCILESEHCDHCKHRSLILLNSPKGREITEQENIQNVNIIDPGVEAKLFFLNDNLGYILLFIIWALIIFSTYILYKYFSSL